MKREAVGKLPFKVNNEVFYIVFYEVKDSGLGKFYIQWADRKGRTQSDKNGRDFYIHYDVKDFTDTAKIKYLIDSYFKSIVESLNNFLSDKNAYSYGNTWDSDIWQPKYTISRFKNIPTFYIVADIPAVKKLPHYSKYLLEVSTMQLFRNLHKMTNDAKTLSSIVKMHGRKVRELHEMMKIGVDERKNFITALYSRLLGKKAYYALWDLRQREKVFYNLLLSYREKTGQVFSPYALYQRPEYYAIDEKVGKIINFLFDGITLKTLEEKAVSVYGKSAFARDILSFNKRQTEKLKRKSDKVYGYFTSSEFPVFRVAHVSSVKESIAKLIDFNVDAPNRKIGSIKETYVEISLKNLFGGEYKEASSLFKKPNNLSL